MNPLPFFPPPSRALSRLNDKPPPASSLSRTSTNTGRPSQPSARSGPSRSAGNGSNNGSSSSPQSEASGGTSPSTISLNGSERSSQPRKRTASGPSNLDGPRSPLGDAPLSEILPTRSSTNRPTSSGTSTPTTGGRLGTRLPPGLYFDLIRASETSAAYRLERAGYPQEDAASLETLRYRQKVAPHLFLGAFLPVAPPKVSGPLTMAGPSQRKLIAYSCATAASALTARSMKVHSDDEHSWLVCLHSVCVAAEYQRRGLALKMVEEFMKRLRKAEEGQGGAQRPKKGYECVALLAHEELVPLYEKLGFKTLGVSHVNWGTGGWFEMRRYIVPREGDDDEGGASKAARQDTVIKLGSQEDVLAPSLPLPSSVSDEATSLTASASDVDQEKGSYFNSPQLLAHSPPNSAPMSPVSEGATRRQQSQGTSSAPEGNLGLPEGISSSQIIEALKKQASSPGTPDGGPRNPGIAYATIMGQTLAAKTTVEDAFFALEARLVDRESGTNLGEIYCPREECACLLLKVKEADWEVAELGPLASSTLSLPDSPSPPTAPVPPPPKSLERIRRALGSSSSSTSTPVRAFWCVYSPMAFENIGFSKDDDWVPPISVTSPRLSGSESDKAVPERKKPTKRGSLFRGPSERKKEGREKQAQMEKEGREKQAQMEREANDAAVGSIPTESVKVKYLLCADCDCGPLGYTVLPSSLQDGKFAQEVGKTLEGQAPESQQEPPVYLIAADRVRYRFVKN